MVNTYVLYIYLLIAKYKHILLIVCEVVGQRTQRLCSQTSFSSTEIVLNNLNQSQACFDLSAQQPHSPTLPPTARAQIVLCWRQLHGPLPTAADAHARLLAFFPEQTRQRKLLVPNDKLTQDRVQIQSTMLSWLYRVYEGCAFQKDTY